MLSFNPRQLACTGRVIAVEGGWHLVVTVLALFPFDAPEQLLPASELSKLVESELGTAAALDVGLD